MTELIIFLSLASLVFFVGALVMLRPFMTARTAVFFACVLAGLSMAAAVGSSVLTGWPR